MRIAVAGATGVVGRHVAAAVGAAGHDLVPISRADGIDLATGEGLDAALRGVDVVIDATSPGPRPDGSDRDFFRTSAGNLHRVGCEQEVSHLVVLSIVGIDGAVDGHPAAKLVHEEAALVGPVPVTVLRATQFHEFPAQTIGWTSDGTSARVPHSRVQTVAARTVGEVLVEVAAGPPLGRAADLAGPEEADLFDLATEFARRFDLALDLMATEDPSPPGSRLPGPDARIAGPSFAEWLSTDDAARFA